MIDGLIYLYTYSHILDCWFQRLRKWRWVSNIFGTDHRTKTIKTIFETTLAANLLDKKKKNFNRKPKCYCEVQRIFLVSSLSCFLLFLGAWKVFPSNVTKVMAFNGKSKLKFSIHDEVLEQKEMNDCAVYYTNIQLVVWRQKRRPERTEHKRLHKHSIGLSNVDPYLFFSKENTRQLCPQPPPSFFFS